MSEQQKQTLTYFNAFASDWQDKALGKKVKVNVIEKRNNAVLAALATLDVKHFIDVGCGTGQLVIAAAGKGITSLGVDFAPEMIEICQQNLKDAKVANAGFTIASIFDYPDPATPFDAVSAQGFIEYVSAQQMEDFFAKSAKMLRPGGALVLGSRNRLFNCVSFNAFTEIELRLGVLDNLVRQNIVLQSNDNLDTVFAELRKLEKIEPQADKHPSTTGIEVAVRYQYSPAELIMRARAHGFAPKMIYPVHFHGVPLHMKDSQPQLHVQLADLLEAQAQSDWRIVPFCSTFVLDLRKQ